MLGGQSVVPHVYPHQIAFNVLPQIDVFLDNAYTKEEWKMVEETRKIMHADDVLVSATCVRVPVFISHSEAVNVEFTNCYFARRRPAHTGPGARRARAGRPGHQPLSPSLDGRRHRRYLCGTHPPGRLQSNSLVMWIVADNVRKGAALNAVQIAEEMVRHEWLQPGG